MKIKSWLRYLIYIVLIVVVVYIKGYVEYICQKKMNDAKVEVYMFIAMATITMAVGVVLGLEYFLTQVKTSGKWKVNVPKLVLLGAPTLYISAFYIIAFTVGDKATSLFIYPIFQFFHSGSFISIFQTIFGYVLITSFYKVGVQQNIKDSAESDEDEFDETEEAEQYELQDQEMDSDSIAECYCK